MKTFLLGIVSVLIIRWAQSDSCDPKYPSRVKYYEDIIQKFTKESFHYNLPTNAEEFRPRSSKVLDFGSYDFIVVGSGSAGSALASRLSEIEEWNVLLLEAGDKYDDFSEIPAMHSYLQGLRFNWNYNTTRQTEACLGMIDQRCPIPRGKVLGGTSTINGLVYCRGNKADYDQWAADGNDGWSYKDILPYFIKSENVQVDGDPGYHGKGGDWNVKYHNPISPQLDALVASNRRLFNHTSNDYNGKCQLGMFYAQLSNIRQYRHNTAKAFITSNLQKRKNLSVLLNSFVIKVLIDERTKTAYGVEFSNGGGLYRVLAKNEVVVSAGSINSPQLLMLSGIGPSKDLRKVGIRPIADLPVGEQLYDHPMFFGLYVKTNYTEPGKSLKQNVEEFLADRGLYTIALNSQGVGFYQSTYAKTPGLPDIELEVVASNSTNDFLKRSFKLTDEAYKSFIEGVDPKTCFCVYLINLKPKSVGNVKLASSNPYEYPLVDYRFLTHPQDVEIIYQALQVVEKLLTAPEMKKMDAKIILADYRQCRKFPKGSKCYWKCAFRLITSGVYHPMSSCRMGPNPKNSVVNNELKVHGFKKLRVADASVIPHPISSHTSAPSVVIAEKVADLIKKEYGKRVDPITNVFGTNS